MNKYTTRALPHSAHNSSCSSPSASFITLLLLFGVSRPQRRLFSMHVCGGGGSEWHQFLGPTLRSICPGTIWAVLLYFSNINIKENHRYVSTDVCLWMSFFEQFAQYLKWLSRDYGTFKPRSVPERLKYTVYSSSFNGGGWIFSQQMRKPKVILLPLICAGLQASNSYIN